MRNRLPLTNALLSLFLFVWLPVPGTNAQVPLRYKDYIFDSLAVTQNLQYGQAINTVTGQEEVLLLDLYQPVPDSSRFRAALVWIHGGGFTGGDKTSTFIVSLCRDFASKGYVTASINYRLHNQYISFEDTTLAVEATTQAYEDAKAAIRWLRKNAATYRIDVDRVGIGGLSAGAITALHTTYEEPEGASGNPGYSSQVGACMEISGALIDDLIMEPDEAPVLIVHGTADTRVPYIQALELQNRALVAGVFHEFHPILGAGHDLSPYIQEILQWGTDFFYQYLILSSSVPVELASFSATVKGNEVLLRWTTASESTNLGFLVQRKRSSGSWQDVAFIPGAGTTTAGREYVYTDRHVPSGRYAYRLKQIDTDGRFAFSGEIDVSVEGAGNYAMLRAYPNPLHLNRTGAAATIRYRLSEGFDLPARLHVFNALGVEVFQQEIHSGTSGDVDFSPGAVQNLQALPAGNYFIVLEAGNRQLTARFTILH